MIKLAAALGGKYAEENIRKISLRELLAYSGDMARQIADVPDGGRVIITPSEQPNKTDAGNGSNGISRVIDASRSPSPDPGRSGCSFRLMACCGVQSSPCPFVPLLPGSGFPPRLALVFGASDIDRECDALPVVFGGEVVSFGCRHYGVGSWASVSAYSGEAFQSASMLSVQSRPLLVHST